MLWLRYLQYNRYILLPEYIQAKEKAKEAAKELNDTLNKASLLIKEYNDCIADTTAIAYREYYKQGYKFNGK